MHKSIKITVIAASLAVAFSASANEAQEQVAQATPEATAQLSASPSDATTSSPVAQADANKQAVQAAEQPVTMKAQGKADEPKEKDQPVSSESEMAARFMTKKGTGGSQTASKAAPVKLPEGPLGKAPEDINKVLAEAQRAGGQGLDAVQREINMPGLKKDDPALKPFVLHTRNGVNEIVKMSASLLNRIATPFKKPVLIDTTNSVSKIVGSDIYYTPSGNKPIGLYIADSANTSQTISLTVIPDETIPGQNLIVKLEDLRAVQKNIALAAATDAEAEVVQPKSSDYSSFIRSLMARAVRGSIPGFAPVPLEGGVARMGDLNIEPELTFAGSVVDIYRYRIQNVGQDPLDLVETAFYRKGVKAVSFFPRMSLQPGQESYVFLLADKPESGAQEVSQ